ncbi:MAG: hypothetical protein QM532_04055 [Cyanobium sp. MAG06]|nr:hypothetical protein [Cyanobium sp. MAG06]
MKYSLTINNDNINLNSPFLKITGVLPDSFSIVANVINTKKILQNKSKSLNINTEI